MDLYDFALWLGFPEEGAAVMRDVFPTPQEARELLERFDRDEKDFFAALRSLPRPERTGLQRSLKRYLLSGHRVSMGLGFVRAELTGAARTAEENGGVWYEK